MWHTIWDVRTRGNPDFQKAFGKVPHRRLICKLCYCGMSGQIANWVQDFFTGKSQRVMVEENYLQRVREYYPTCLMAPSLVQLPSSSTLTTWQATSCGQQLETVKSHPYLGVYNGVIKSQRSAKRSMSS